MVLNVAIIENGDVKTVKVWASEFYITIYLMFTNVDVKCFQPLDKSTLCFNSLFQCPIASIFGLFIVANNMDDVKENE